MTAKDYKQIMIVRGDLELSAGKMAAQVAHGSLGSAIKVMKKKKKVFDSWKRYGQKKVVLKAKDLSHLKKLAESAKKNRLAYEMVKDMGLTELRPGTITVLAIGPDDEKKIDKVAGDLPLV